MRGGPGVVKVGIKDFQHRNAGTEPRIAIALTPAWQTYAIPLNAFTGGANAQDLRQLFVVAEFVNETKIGFSARVRNVRLSAGAASSIPPPSNAAGLGGSVAVHSSLTLDSRDWPYIAYFDLDAQKLRVAWRAEQFQVGRDGSQAKVSRWQVVDLPDHAGDIFAGEYTSIKADDQDNIHVAYWTLGGPRYVLLNGTDDRASLVSESIESSKVAGQFISLDVVTIKNVREPQVAYHDLGGTANRLKLTRRQNGGLGSTRNRRSQRRCRCVCVTENHISRSSLHRLSGSGSRQRRSRDSRSRLRGACISRHLFNP